MQLHALTQGCPVVCRSGPHDRPIPGLTDDSRRVQPGELFICRGALDARARGYVAMAAERGAGAVLTDAQGADALPPLPETVTHLVARPGTAVDQRLAGRLAQRFFGHPARRLTAIGITGTNGKTTTATLTQHLLRQAGRRPGLIGTIHLDTGRPDGAQPAQLTTPGAIDLARLLAEMVANGLDSVVMEVSSHALEQGRADQAAFAAGCFTNLTQDHLDYHGTMQRYADAKALLFESLNADAAAVLNGDDPASERMARGCRAGIITTHVLKGSGASPRGADAACVEALELSSAGSRARFTGRWGAFEARLPLVGPHNLSNALQAAALAHAVTAIDAPTLREALEGCPPVPGRLEPVGPDWPRPLRPDAAHPLPTVLVDYAHTPDALVNAATSLRPLLPGAGRLIVLFGCGGDRDRAKRPLMARAACAHADVAVLTSDNPRTEDPRLILADAAEGFADAPAHVDTHTEIDRAEAIRLAIGMARADDTVLIAGKGHESYQDIQHVKHPFDDREHAAAALRERAASPVPTHPTP
jgi:UDP-N-acetylmuramoyl-L-alanyl-D-glutamate--2,6-diaminopimelate ligase